MATTSAHHPGRIKWLAMTLILLCATPMLSSFFPSGPYMLAAIWFTNAVPVGVLLTLSFWVGMGKSPVVLRMVGGLMGAVYVTVMVTVAQVVHSTVSGMAHEAQPIVDYVLAVAMYAAVLLLFGGVFMLIGRRWTLRVVEDEASVADKRFQFSMLQILLLTTAAAVVFFLMHAARRDEDPATQWHMIAAMLLGFGTFFVNTLLAAFATLQTGSIRLSLTLVALVSLLLGLAVSISSGHEVLGWQYVAFGTLTCSIPTLVVVLSLLVVRSVGYRLLRARREAGEHLREPIA